MKAPVIRCFVSGVLMCAVLCLGLMATGCSSDSPTKAGDQPTPPPPQDEPINTVGKETNGAAPLPFDGEDGDF